MNKTPSKRPLVWCPVCGDHTPHLRSREKEFGRAFTGRRFWLFYLVRCVNWRHCGDRWHSKAFEDPSQ